MKSRRLFKLLGLTAAIGTAAYGAYAWNAWANYGRPRRPRPEETDPFLDEFLPGYEVVERHHIAVNAPAELTLGVACEIDFEDSRVIRGIIRMRELLLGAKGSREKLPHGLIAKTTALGWGKLGEIPGRQIVMGAATQPWLANVVFRALPPEEFATFAEPEYVKIAWTLRVDSVTTDTCIFRTETRVLACGTEAREKFRKYWALLSPGILLIRLALLGPVKREAESRARKRISPASQTSAISSTSRSRRFPIASRLTHTARTHK